MYRLTKILPSMCTDAWRSIAKHLKLAMGTDTESEGTDSISIAVRNVCNTWSTGDYGKSQSTFLKS